MIARRRVFLLFAGIVLLLGAVSARAAILRGVVIDEERRETVPLAVVTVGDAAAAETDSLGRFRLEGLPAGTTAVRVEHVGFEPWSRRMRLREDRDNELLVRLHPRISTIAPVEVTSARPDPGVVQSKKLILVDKIRSGAGNVMTDPARYVQSLPSVAAAAGDDFTNRYVVRGGDPEENLVLVDGYQLLQPIHLEGFTSVVYDDLIQEIEFYPGALPPRFGEALSSIASFRLLPPKFTQRFFRYDLGSVALGGQTLKGGVDAIASARTSFYNLILRRPPGVDKRSFQDFAGRLRGRIGKQEISVTSVLSRDREEGDFDRSVDAGLVGIRTGRSTVASDWNVAVSASERRRKFTQRRPRQETRADLQRLALQGGWIGRIGGEWQVRADGDGRFERFKDLDQSFESQGAALGAEGTWMPQPLALALGSRVERIPFTKGTSVSPYASVRLRNLGRVTPGAGWRMIRQSPFALHDEPEVAGLPVDSGELLTAAEDEIVPMEARHLSGSLEADLGRGFAATLEIYRKEYRRLPTWGADGPAAGTIGDHGHGEGKGIEFSLRRDAGRYATGWVSYVLSRTRKKEGPATETHRAAYDRPRMLQAALEVPVRGGTTLSFAYRAATGRPTTPLNGRGDGTLEPGEINSERLPSYRRLDAKLEHRIEGKKNSAFLYLDVLNLMNRRNIVDVVQYVGVGGEVVRLRTLGVRILPVAGFGFYF